MCVNNFLFSEAGREFRLPMGSAPIHRTNSRGRIMCRTGAVPDRYHPNAFVNSLMLCLLDVCNVAHCVGWVPIYVNYSSVTAAMRLMRNRQKSNFDFWNNTYRKCKSNSNFPHQLPELSVATSRRQWARRLHLPQLHSDTVYLKTMPHDV